MDVKLHIYHNLRQLINTWNTKYVYGHQDHKKKHHKTWQTLLNIRAYTLSTKSRISLEKKKRTTNPEVHKACGAELFIGDTQITKNYASNINKAWTSVGLCNYMTTKYSWHHKICEIDWFPF